MQENIAVRSVEEIAVEEGIFILTGRNDTLELKKLDRDIDRGYIQFHFCLKGRGKFLYNGGRYALDLSEDRSLILYNTQQDLDLAMELSPGSWMVSVIVAIRRFHALFSREAEMIPFLDASENEKKYYGQEAISPAMAVVVSQMLQNHMHRSVRGLFLRGKVYELMALYFNRSVDNDKEQCPYLVDEDQIRRIRKAKDIIIARMVEPPRLPELADEVGLSLKRLKEGFKQVYGDTVYAFLFDFKMEHARRLLESGQNNVNEIGLRVGYSTASHFISAFKKKYGTTPKKYLMSRATLV